MGKWVGPGILVFSILALFPDAALLLSRLRAAEGAEDPKEAGKKKAPEAKALLDRVILSDGTQLEGTILDLPPGDLIIQCAKGKRFIPADSIKEVERSISAKFLAFFKTQMEKCVSVADLKRLARFSRARGAIPECRACLRKALKLEPGDEEAHRDLGEALLDGKWLPEKVVEALLLKGFHSVGGKLVKSVESAAKGDEAPGGASVGEEGGGEGLPRTPGIDEQYVRDNLEAFLHPTSMSFNDDGRVNLTFSFADKDDDLVASFTPNIGNRLDSTFRWTVRREESWTTYTSGESLPTLVGVKVANSGSAFLNCWFLDDVEVEISYSPLVSIVKTQGMALVFGDEKSKLIGNNFGTQCVTFTRGNLASVKGNIEELTFRDTTRFALSVRGGSFQALRQNRPKQKATYAPKDFPSGRIGLVWRGGVAGVITDLEVSGKIDFREMASVIRGSRSQ
ncbi:MAG TPA: bacterial transcriptional activator domain-containing protein [Planctomycetota bacterium]|nr:bacterial transcriptional activator domain-containing protein [Planctomycetota bacterium]